MKKEKKKKKKHRDGARKTLSKTLFDFGDRENEREREQWERNMNAIQPQKLTDCNRMQITLVNLLSD